MADAKTNTDAAAAAAAPKDPDNIWVSQGKKDETKVYIGTPTSYRSAKAAIKEAGGIWKGSNWELSGDVFKTAEAGIRAAAREDIALGSEGRKAREAELKAATPEKPAKVELTEEQKIAQAAEREAAMKLRDATQLPVVVGTVAVGDTVTAAGAEQTVTALGSEWELDAEGVDRLKERFGDVDGMVVGAKVQFAKFPEPVAEEEATPSM